MRRLSYTVRTAGLVLSIAASLLASGCLSGPMAQGNAANPGLDTKVFAMSCDDGRRTAAKAFKARNYKITGVDRGPSQTVITAHNDVDDVTSSITVNCQGNGVTVQTEGSSMWIRDGLRFGFYQIAETGDKIWPPPTAPVVSMSLYRGPEAKIEFPTELEPLGMVAVRVKVLNAGDRPLRIDPRRLLATTASGAKARPLAQSDAQAKLAGSDPEIGKKLLTATKLAKGESVTGFVFFPVAEYESVAIALIDDKTGEADDYDVHLAATT